METRMSLTTKPTATEKEIAASQTNGQRTRGPAIVDRRSQWA